MLPRPRPRRRIARAGLRALLAGTLALGAVGSCELPKPQIPSIGATQVTPGLAVGIDRSRAGAQ
jgi:hypothetical protein